MIPGSPVMLATLLDASSDVTSAPAPEGAPPWTGFAIALALTVLLLVGTLVTGFRGQRRAHVPFAILTILALLAAIWFAETIGRYWVFPATALRIHLSFAWAGTILILPVLVSGVLALRRPGPARWHRRLVFAFLGIVLCAIGTGIWIFATGTPKS